MIYLYCFEDGSICQSGESPTPIDCEAVEQGILSVFRFDPVISGTVFEFDGMDKWIPVEPAQAPTEEQPYHQVPLHP